LPRDRCQVTSPAEIERRGPYICFAARSDNETRALYQRMQEEMLFASLREGNIRVSTHLYNTEEEIDKLLEVIRR
jgi:cysteine desulfurase/selenocysteine lyase